MLPTLVPSPTVNILRILCADKSKEKTSRYGSLKDTLGWDKIYKIRKVLSRRHQAISLDSEKGVIVLNLSKRELKEEVFKETVTRVKRIQGAVEIVQQLSSLVVHLEDSCSLPSTHIMAHTIWNSSSRGSEGFFRPLGNRHAHAQTRKQARHSYT